VDWHPRPADPRVWERKNRPKTDFCKQKKPRKDFLQFSENYFLIKYCSVADRQHSVADPNLSFYWDTAPDPTVYKSAVILTFFGKFWILTHLKVQN